MLRSLEFRVKEALRNATANGYADWIRDSQPREIASDLADKDASLEGVPVDQMIPLIVHWKSAHAD